MLVKLTILLFTINFLYPQVETNWIKSFGDGKLQSGFQSITLPTDKIVTIGITKGNTDYLEEVYILISSLNGTTLFSNSIDTNHKIINPSICTSLDDCFVISYSSIDVDGESTINISKYDSRGRNIWVRKYEDINYGIVKSIQQTNDGFILIGNSLIGSSLNSSLLLIKVDTKGVIQWSNKYSNLGGGKAVAVSPNGFYALIGSLGNKIIKTDKQGNKLWQKSLSENMKALYINSTNDNGFIITGIFNSSLMLLKIDSDGANEWIRLYKENHRGIGYYSVETYDNHIVTTGQLFFEDNIIGLYIFKTTYQGEVVWELLKLMELTTDITESHLLSPSIPINDLYHIEEVSPTQFILTGTVIDNNDLDIGLMKISQQILGYGNINQSIEGNIKLYQNVPNPFNISTSIIYEVLNPLNIKIVIYDISGNEVVELIDKHHTIGRYNIEWNGLNKYGNPVSAGAYFYAIQLGNSFQSKKLLLLK